MDAYNSVQALVRQYETPGIYSDEVVSKFKLFGLTVSNTSFHAWFKSVKCRVNIHADYSNNTRSINIVPETIGMGTAESPLNISSDASSPIGLFCPLDYLLTNLKDIIKTILNWDPPVFWRIIHYITKSVELVNNRAEYILSLDKEKKILRKITLNVRLNAASKSDEEFLVDINNINKQREKIIELSDEYAHHVNKSFGQFRGNVLHEFYGISNSDISSLVSVMSHLTNRVKALEEYILSTQQ